MLAMAKILHVFLVGHCLEMFAGERTNPLNNNVPCDLFILIKNKFDLIARNAVLDSTVVHAIQQQQQPAKIALNLNNNVSCGDATKSARCSFDKCRPCVPYRIYWAQMKTRKTPPLNRN